MAGAVRHNQSQVAAGARAAGGEEGEQAVAARWEGRGFHCERGGGAHFELEIRKRAPTNPGVPGALVLHPEVSPGNAWI